MSEPTSENQGEVRPSLLYKRPVITLGHELLLTVFLLVLGAGLISVFAWLGTPTDNLLVTVPFAAVGVLILLSLAFLAFDIVVTVVAAIPFRAWVIILLLLILLVLIFK